MSPEPVWAAVLASSAAVLLGGGGSSGDRLHRSRDGQDLSERAGRRSRRYSPMPLGLVLDLVAAGLDSGVPVSAAVRAVSDVLDSADDPGAGLLTGAAGTSPASGDGADADIGRADPRGALHRALHLAQTTGIAPASLVRSAAEQERRRRMAAQMVAARRLAVYAVIPLALCLLPAFLVLTVIPVVLDLLSGL